jgi:type III secretion system YscQ/HrcQ family protein
MAMSSASVMPMAEPNKIVDFPDARAAQQEQMNAPLNVSSLESALTTIDPQTRDVLNDWLSRRCAPMFQLGAEEFEIRWLQNNGQQWHVLIELGAGNYRALLALDGFAALDPLLVGEPFTLMPSALRSLAVQRLVARILGYAPPALANTLEVRAILWEGRGLPDWRCRLPFLLRRRDGTQLTGTLLFESAAALQWLDGVLPVDRTSNAKRLQLATLLRLTLGESKVSPAALQSLDPGDVVWIENGSITREGVAIGLNAPSARSSWRCRVRRELLRIVSASEISSSAKPKSSAPLQASAASGAGVPPMDAQRWQLEVPVTFDLGELQLQVADLERLQPGHIIELPQDVATATISLRVADRCIAEGTLIAVGKRLGVRIGAVIAQPAAGAA